MSERDTAARTDPDHTAESSPRRDAPTMRVSPYVRAQGQSPDAPTTRVNPSVRTPRHSSDTPNLQLRQSIPARPQNLLNAPTLRLRSWFTPWPTKDSRGGSPDAVTYPAIPDPGFELVADDAPGYELRPTTEPGWSAAASRRRTRVSRGVLICLLLLQALLSLRLDNTAFQDEALYLFAGHAELDHLVHGTPVLASFDQYFSGAPVLYPVLAAAIDSLFGLTGVRAMSLLIMLCTTALLYSFSRRLFNERAGLCAAGAFAVAQSTLFMGNFATFDAMALFLLAAATWIVVYTATRHPLLCLLAAPVAGLAVWTKYAAALYLPTIVLLLALTSYRRHGIGRALLHAALLAAAIIGLLLGALYATNYLQAIQGTTTNRSPGTTGAMAILVDCLKWGGLLVAAAVLGTVLYARQRRLSEMPGLRHALPGARWRLTLGLLLTGTALLAPLYQIHLATSVSMHKHIGYGLLFAAPMAGVGVTRLMGAHFKFPQVAIALGVAMLTMGMTQSAQLFRVWPDSTQLVSVLRQHVTPGGHYLADTHEVPVYYLAERTSYTQWNSTYVITYIDHQGRTLTGVPGFRAAIDDQYFDLVVLDSQQSRETSNAVRAQMREHGGYRLVATLPYTTWGPGAYEVWAKDVSPH